MADASTNGTIQTPAQAIFKGPTLLGMKCRKSNGLGADTATAGCTLRAVACPDEVGSTTKPGALKT